MLKWVKRLFKKKVKEEDIVEIIVPKPKMDFSDIKFEMNIKSICYFEKMINGSFYSFSEDKIFQLIYSIFITNNPSKNITFDAFMFLMQREDIAQYFLKSFTDCTDIIKQLNKVKEKCDESSLKEIELGEKSVTDYATTLIINYGVDANYVMYKMGIWELLPFYEAVDTKVKHDMQMERFWTYIKVCPHIDTKKVKSPEHLIPFEWEKASIKKRKEQDLKNNMFAIKNMIGKSIFAGKEKKNEQE